MARFKDQRKGGSAYSVKVTDGKNGQTVGSFHVVTRGVKAARVEAIFQAKVSGRVIDDSNLYAHAPRKAA